MRRKVARWTGMAVTFVVVLGSDFDVVLALPLGLFAGGLAAILTWFAEPRAANGRSAPQVLRTE